MSRPTAAERQPKYLRIHGLLRDRITTGQWPAGSPLPAQRELADEFGVSLMTLRQALQLLIDDGLVDTRHGSGTYVAERYAYDLGHLRSFAGDETTCTAAPATLVHCDSRPLILSPGNFTTFIFFFVFQLRNSSIAIDER